jgi:hypothetical protein
MMKKLKSTFFTLFVLLSFFGFSQSKKDLVDELSQLIQSRNRQAEVFFTDYTGKLDINGNQIPLSQVGMYYTEKNGPMLVFQCILKTKVNCIQKPKTDHSFEIFSVPMDDKESVDRAMEIINRLK